MDLTPTRVMPDAWSLRSRHLSRHGQSSVIADVGQKYMLFSFGHFSESAARFSKNPLGIIALFIVLVYGIAGLVFGVTGGSLQPAERTPLIWFLVLFPCLVLGLFGWLVSRHHTKLYSPSDYPDKEGFFRALTPSEQKHRIEKEIELSSEVSPPALTGAYKQPTKPFRGLDRSNFLIAEDLVFRELQAEYGVSISRQVALVGKDIGFDGLFTKDEKTYIVDVKLFASPLSVLNTAKSLGNQLLRYRNALPEHVKPAFVLAIVYNEYLEDSKIDAYNLLTHVLNKLRCEYDIKTYDFDKLKAKYGITE